jgi:hypothetical protein
MKSQGKSKIRKWKQACLLAAGAVILSLAVLLWVRCCFVFAEGVKTGQLNYVVYKGYLFKTYEGKLIPQGSQPEGAGENAPSSEFEFSVTDPALAEKLMLAGGREVDLHYKEYTGALPWRSKYVVDSIINIR